MLLAILIDMLLMCSFQVKCSSTYTPPSWAASTI